MQLTHFVYARGGLQRAQAEATALSARVRAHDPHAERLQPIELAQQPGAPAADVDVRSAQQHRVPPEIIRRGSRGAQTWRAGGSEGQIWRDRAPEVHAKEVEVGAVEVQRSTLTAYKEVRLSRCVAQTREQHANC